MKNSEPDLPRGHAYIRMRNRGYKIDIDWPEMDAPQAQRMIEAVMAIMTAEDEKDNAAADQLRDAAKEMLASKL